MKITIFLKIFEVRNGLIVGTPFDCGFLNYANPHSVPIDQGKMICATANWLFLASDAKMVTCHQPSFVSICSLQPASKHMRTFDEPMANKIGQIQIRTIYRTCYM